MYVYVISWKFWFMGGKDGCEGEVWGHYQDSPVKLLIQVVREIYVRQGKSGNLKTYDCGDYYVRRCSCVNLYTSLFL